MASHPEKFHAALIALLATFALGAAPALHAQSLPAVFAPSPNMLAGEPDVYDEEEEADNIIGAVEGDHYISPTGAFRITIPVIPELGGQITDNANVVTFQDAFGEHASIGCFPMNDNLRAEETKRGSRKEFLVWFFQNFIQADFARSVPGASAEPNARFINGTQGGAFFAQLLLPNGSVFAERVFVFPPRPQHVAKRGNLIFVNNDNIYVLSVELSERVFEFSTYNKTAAEEEEMLRKRLTELLGSITFTPRHASAPATDNTPAAPVKIAPATPPAPTASEVPSITFPPAAGNLKSQ
jgi:hypothetical protein